MIQSNLPGINGFQQFKTELETILQNLSRTGEGSPVSISQSLTGVNFTQSGVSTTIGEGSTYAGVVTPTLLSRLSGRDKNFFYEAPVDPTGFSVAKVSLPPTDNLIGCNLNDPRIFISGETFTEMSVYASNTYQGGSAIYTQNGINYVNLRSSIMHYGLERVQSPRILKCKIFVPGSIASTKIYFRFAVPENNNETFMLRINGTDVSSVPFKVPGGTTKMTPMSNEPTAGFIGNDANEVTMELTIPLNNNTADVELAFHGLSKITFFGMSKIAGAQFIPVKRPANKIFIIATDQNESQIGGQSHPLKTTAFELARRSGSNFVIVQTRGMGFTTNGFLVSGHGTNIGASTYADLYARIVEFQPNTVMFLGCGDNETAINDVGYNSSLNTSVSNLRSILGDGVKIILSNNQYTVDSFSTTQKLLTTYLKGISDVNFSFMDLTGVSEYTTKIVWNFTSSFPNNSVVVHNDGVYKFVSGGKQTTVVDGYYVTSGRTSPVARGLMCAPGKDEQWIPLGVCPMEGDSSSLVSGTYRTERGTIYEACNIANYLRFNNLIQFD